MIWAVYDRYSVTYHEEFETREEARQYLEHYLEEGQLFPLGLVDNGTIIPYEENDEDLIKDIKKYLAT